MNLSPKLSYLPKKSMLLVLFAFVFSAFRLQAQGSDFTTWTTAGIEYKLKPAFSLVGDVEWRTKGNFDQTDRFGVKLGGQYAPLSFLKLGGGYEIHYRNRGSQGWKFRHRYYIDGTLSVKWSRLKLALRERAQHTFAAQSDEFRLRTRLKLAYDLPKSKVEPYASVEMYNSLHRGEHFEVTRMRYRGGVSLPIASRWTADLFYTYQYESHKTKHILGVECVYKF